VSSTEKESLLGREVSKVWYDSYYNGRKELRKNPPLISGKQKTGMTSGSQMGVMDGRGEGVKPCSP